MFGWVNRKFQTPVRINRNEGNLADDKSKGIEDSETAPKKNISLRKVSLTSVPAGITKITNLKSLDLYCNEITEFPFDVSNIAGSLIRLNMARNRLVCLDQGIMSLSSLEELNLSSNKGLKIKCKVVNTQNGSVINNDQMESNLVALKKLHLSDCQLKTVPPSFLCKLTSLEILDISMNLLDDLQFCESVKEGIDTVTPMHSSLLSNLQSLYLNDNSMTAFPTGIGQLYSLHTLIMCNNNITSFPSDSLEGLHQLEVLDLTVNAIDNIPPSIGLLTNLHVLCLGQNHLKSLPNEIGLLSRLRSLQLPDNNICELPQCIETLSQNCPPIEFGYSEPNMGTVSRKVPTKPMLTSLDFCGNPISRVPDLITVQYPLAFSIPNYVSLNCWISAYDSALNISALKQCGITHVVTVGLDMPPAYPDCFTYMLVPIWDTDAARIINFFKDICCFIAHALGLDENQWPPLPTDGEIGAAVEASALLRGRREVLHDNISIVGQANEENPKAKTNTAINPKTQVLIHCSAGQSRSATVLASFLMWMKSMSYFDALDIIKTARPSVKPNAGFLDQLGIWETLLKGC